MKLKYPFNLMAVGAKLTFPTASAQAVRQAMCNYAKRHGMYFRSKRHPTMSELIVITRVV